MTRFLLGFSLSWRVANDINAGAKHRSQVAGNGCVLKRMGEKACDAHRTAFLGLRGEIAVPLYSYDTDRPKI